MTSLIAGFKSFFVGISFIQEHKLWKYIVIPSLISLTIGILLTFGIYLSITTWVLSFLDGVSKLDFSGFWGNILDVILWLVLFIGKAFIHLASFVIGAVISIILYTTLASILIDPFMGTLHEKVEEIITGEIIETATSNDIKSIVLGVVFSLKSALRSLAWLLLSMMTGPLQPVLMFVVESKALGGESFDLLFEKSSFTIEERKQELKKYQMHMTGLGMAKLLMIMTVIGTFIVPAASITGAALIYHNK